MAGHLGPEPGEEQGGREGEQGEAVISELEAGRLLAGLEQLQADYERTIAAGPPQASAEEESDGEGGGGAAAEGYEALGSDDGSEHSDGEGSQLDDGLAAAEAAGDPADDSSAPHEAAVALEDFADFSDENPALPMPPAAPPQLLSTPLTPDDVQLIQKTMQKVCPPPPSWAQNLSDDKLERMVRDLARTP
mmetsp:Transcript_51980/g.151017  ORF Transcript_51980/g.151017 Transcript_51980/m.151017 type:complete len:191 (-) Transcript_51980:185-757(-)